MPTALDAGRYSSNGFQVSCQRQDVRATGLPAPSTWASAARNAGVMTAVEWPRKIGSYCRHVSGGGLESAPLTGENSSAGFGRAREPPVAADQSGRKPPPPMTNVPQPRPPLPLPPFLT